ncbi:MAG: NCS2 family permease [Lachnospiraceae bacterium]|jgi:AGZA family xanthine/uracil permease-like MFS transporter|nr:NCS2 family permease [Lachnospiraceae bacterium]MCH4108449.1 NCS2 family permease [Lachnospiraceae bacterium]MCI1302536.1 NCS2 family permease [Lachnospiraceae bacterium]MCI1331709.1 NCS2 family permease [Lachnospiraceae bacterium]MCI1360967.1 NCS2 family permease [Lachnospiraceae bacterium]
MFEKVFKLKKYGTNVRTEVVAGLTTFLAMAYILAVNPSILGNVMDANGVFVATALASAIATFIMAFLANYPVALSAGMGLNAYFAFTVCLGDLKDVPNAFTIALTAVLVEGIIFILLSLFKVREAIVNGIPMNLKYGITAGIGLFITMIGLKDANIVVANDSTLITLGDFSQADVVLCLIGLMIMVVLSAYNVKGSILIGILITWILGMIAQVGGWYTATNVFPDFSGGINLSGITNTAFKFNFAWAGAHLAEFAAIVFSFLFVDLFDTVGTVVGVADKAHLLDENGKLPRAGRVLLSDAIGTCVGACLGTSTITSFVESSAGVAEGGKTGLTSFTTACLFLLSLLFAPVFLAIPSFATSPALIYVGMMMIMSVTKMSFDKDPADAIGGFLAIAIMPLTYSIANGIMFAMLSWVIVKVCMKKANEVSPVMWGIFALFIIRIITLALHLQ